MSSVYVKTIDFPTDIIEDEWASVRVYEYAGQFYASLVFPREKTVGEDTAIRLENIGLSLFHQERKAKNE
jgi:hypothetical protein